MSGMITTHKDTVNKSDFPAAERRKIPRIAALHDLSSFGRCALTVVIPTVSAMGIQCVPVPTALLSTHTGGFCNMYFRDLDSIGAISGIGEHFKELGLDFDAVYTGFLGKSEQVSSVEKFIDDVNAAADEAGKHRPLLFVDPVMGDDGMLYSACLPELADSMRRLTKRADVITPNLTEACLLAGEPYTDTSRMTRSEAEKFAAGLAAILSRITDAVCIITGITMEMGEDAGAEKKKGKYDDPKAPGVGGWNAESAASGYIGTYAAGKMFTERCRGREYPGTGDIFASVMLGKLLESGEITPDSIASAAEFASDFTVYTIDYSVKYGADEPARDGVLLEGCLEKLIRK
ncbi:MAG: bifunctional hydroxymethylpyrimidine kinase/phosphomethylpyrimidine kinase [Clostridia bacterium]|nr:bifunctional hydroxymethylpyrimidine kinase/phosphomethylpyrimidine kinase [Clostridia bacterium]